MRYPLVALVGLVLLAGLVDAADDHDRAGRLLETSPWAHPSDTGRYVGYQVGGGAVVGRRSHAPASHEGTWGWDYAGGLVKRRIIPGWWHGRRYQGGTGAYRAEGPTLLPRLK